jgi:uncharacterized protein (DUF2141 family)
MNRSYRGRAFTLLVLVLGGGPEARADEPPASPPQVAETPVTILADGFASNEGHAYVRIYRRNDKVTSTPWRLLRTTVIKGMIKVETTLPADDYAVVVHHDRNDNGAIDHDLLRMPKEPLGFSNGFTLGLLSGMPTFEKLRVAVRSPSAAVRVTVR